MVGYLQSKILLRFRREQAALSTTTGFAKPGKYRSENTWCNYIPSAWMLVLVQRRMQNPDLTISRNSDACKSET